jgi:hypothetical protein
MPVGNSNGRFFESDFDVALDEYNSGMLTPNADQLRDPMEINPSVSEDPAFDPTLEAGLKQDISYKAPLIGKPSYATVDDQTRLEGSFNAVQQSETDTLRRMKYAQDTEIPANAASTQGQRGAWDMLTGETGERYQTWPEKALRSLVDAFKLPGDVYQGEIDPSSPEASNRATELAGALIFGPAPIARKVVDGTLGVFAGVSSKGVNKNDLAMAQVMERQGRDPEQIWYKTNFFKGIDGRWRYEIPDHEMKLTDIATWKMENKLSDVVDHPQLFKAYPNLKNLDVILDMNLKATASVRGDTIRVNPTKIADEDILKRVLIHELQHKVQSAEKFEWTGSNPNWAYENPYFALVEKHQKTKSPKEQEEIRRLMTDMTMEKDSIGKYLYKRNPGEVEANLAMRRYELGEDYTKMVSPNFSKNWLQEKELLEKEIPIREVDASFYAAKEMASDIPRVVQDRIKWWQKNYGETPTKEQLTSAVKARIGQLQRDITASNKIDKEAANAARQELKELKEFIK